MKPSLRMIGIICGLGIVAVVVTNISANTVATQIEAVKNASTPSAAIEAYSQGLAANRKSVELHEAYLRRLTEFGLAGIASHQAETLRQLDSDNPLAWGVIAFNKAQEGSMDEAIAALDKSAEKLPKDEFVQHLAGQLAAWYDNQTDKSAITDETKQQMERLRTIVEQSPAYKEGYQIATLNLQESEPVANESPAARPLVRKLEAVPADGEADQIEGETVYIEIEEGPPEEVRVYNYYRTYAYPYYGYYGYYPYYRYGYYGDYGWPYYWNGFYFSYGGGHNRHHAHHRRHNVTHFGRRHRGRSRGDAIGGHRDGRVGRGGRNNVLGRTGTRRLGRTGNLRSGDRADTRRLTTRSGRSPTVGGTTRRTRRSGSRTVGRRRTGRSGRSGTIGRRRTGRSGRSGTVRRRRSGGTRTIRASGITRMMQTNQRIAGGQWSVHRSFSPLSSGGSRGRARSVGRSGGSRGRARSVGRSGGSRGRARSVGRGGSRGGRGGGGGRGGHGGGGRGGHGGGGHGGHGGGGR